METQTKEAIMDFQNVYAGYDMTPVIGNINLKITTGENWAILGANGSGKSTLIKLMSNDLYPSSKYQFKKEIFGKERWNIFELKKHLGVISNDLHNKFEAEGSALSAYDVVVSGYFSSINFHTVTKEQNEKALEVMEFLDILKIKEKKVSQMSTGQLRKCIIGRALIHDPQAFILDEPTVGLDIKAQSNFIKTIQKLSKNASIILVTHNIEEIFPEITHVALMYENTLYKQGTKADILTSENLSEIFGIKIDLSKENGRYYIKRIN